MPAAAPYRASGLVLWPRSGLRDDGDWLSTVIQSARERAVVAFKFPRGMKMYEVAWERDGEKLFVTVLHAADEAGAISRAEENLIEHPEIDVDRSGATVRARLSMKAEISFDLVMTEDMPFVEGCYRLSDGVWRIFIFRRSNGIEEVGIKQNLTWKSGVTGLNAILPSDAKIDKSVVLTVLSDALGVTELFEVRGPDSMQLR